jgi:acyl carrier protein
MNEGTVRDRVAAFLRGALRHQDLADEDDVFALGLISSLFAMELVEFVEREFGITVESEDIEMENFRSIAAITRLVEAKSGSAGAAHGMVA